MCFFFRSMYDSFRVLYMCCPNMHKAQTYKTKKMQKNKKCKNKTKKIKTKKKITKLGQVCQSLVASNPTIVEVLSMLCYNLSIYFEKVYHFSIYTLFPIVFFFVCLFAVVISFVSVALHQRCCGSTGSCILFTKKSHCRNFPAFRCSFCKCFCWKQGGFLNAEFSQILRWVFFLFKKKNKINKQIKWFN